MALYKAINDSFSPECRFFKKGEFYELDDPWSEKHFDKVDSAPEPTPPKNEILPMSLATASDMELREIAKARNITFAANIGRDKLIAKILESADIK